MHRVSRWLVSSCAVCFRLEESHYYFFLLKAFDGLFFFSLLKKQQGIIALTLEANPSLTWRDVMYLIVLTSRPNFVYSNNYIENKRELLVSTRYGFGLMDAGRMVEQAQAWTNVPRLNSCRSLRDFILSHSTLSHIEANLYTNVIRRMRSTLNKYK
jgi:hypothetical protein